MKYEISLGAEVRTKDIDKKLREYDGKVNVGVNPQSITSDIDTALKGYHAAPIQVGATLVTKGITDKITSLNKEGNRKNIKIGITPVFDGIETAIGQQTFNTKLGVGVQLKWGGVAAQIAKPDFGSSGIPKFNLDVELNDNAIVAAIDRYVKSGSTKTIPIKIKPDFSELNWSQVETLLGEYEAKTPLKVKLDLSKSEINKKITEYNQTLSQDNGRKILLGAELKANAIADAITNFKTKNTKELSIPIDLTINNAKDIELDSEIKAKLKEYQGNPIWIPVKLKPAEKGFASQISKLPIFVEAKLKNADDINNVISGYANNAVPVEAKLVPATKGFASEITKTPIQIEAELSPTAINNAITNPPKGLSKLPIGITLKPENKDDINNQVKQLAPLVAEALEVNVKLNEQSVNNAISGFTPTATLEVKPNLAIEEVDEKIRTYVPKEQVKVNVLLDDSNIDPNTGKQIERKPIEVNVKLNRESINTQIRDFKTRTKIKVGVKLDFASHKDENGKEIQKGVAKQIKDYDGKTKIKVGIQLDDSDIATQIGQINTSTPVLLGVQLDPTGVQNVRTEIDNLRQELTNLAAININIGGGGGGRGNGNSNGGRGNGYGAGAGGNGGSGGGAGGNGGGTRQVNESTEAYRRLMRVLRELATLRKQLSGLNTLESPDLANSLISQIQTLEQQYNNMMDSIRQRQIQFTTDQQSQMRTLIDSTNRKIERNQSKVDDDAAAENRARAYDRMLSTLEQIHSVEQNIAKLRNQGGNENQIAELEGQLGNLMTTYQGLFDLMERNLTPEQWSSLESEMTEAEQAMALLQSRFEDIRNKLAGGIDDRLNLGDFDAEVKAINSNFGRLSNQSDEAKRAVADLNDALADMKNARGNTEALIAAHEKYVEALKKSKNQIKMQQIDDKDFADTYKDDANELQDVANKIEKIKASLAKLKVGDNSNEINFLTGELKKLESTYKTLQTKLNGKLSPEQLAKLAETANETRYKLELVENQLQDLQNKAAKKIQLKFNDGDFNVLPRLNSEMKKLSGTYPELEAGVKEVENALRDMQNAIGTGDEIADVQGLISAHERLEHVLKNVNNQLSIAKRLEGDNARDQKLIDDRLIFQSQIDAWLRKNSAAADKFGAQMLQLKEQVRNCDRQTLNHLQNEFKQLDMEAESLGLKTQSFADKIKNQFSKYFAYISVAEVIMYAAQAAKDMFEQVKLIDSAMTELKKVTDESDESYNKFLNNAASRAKELGTTIDGLISSTADFARLGYSFEESQGLAEVANVYAVVGDEIEGVEDATQSLVSTLAAFRHEIGDMSNDEFAMSIVDKMNEVSNNYAISSGGIGQALQRSASSMAAANNTLDETIALITAANEVAQNPEKVGNAFKTMSMRIRGAKTELEDAGESTDGMAESTASLREEMLALSGVDIMLNENTFKSTYQIMDELSQKWKGLSDIAQATIIELVAGKHQGNVFSSLMANFDTARAALDTSLNSSGSAMAEHAKWSESLEARLNKLKATWQSLSQTFMSSNFLKGLIDGLIAFVDILDTLINKVGALPVIIGGVTAIESIFGKNKILSVFQILNKDLDGFTNRVGIAGKSLSELMNVFKFGSTGGRFKGSFRGLTSVFSALRGDVLSKSDLSSLQAYNDLIDQCVGSQTAWYRTMQNASPAAQNLVAAANGGKVAISGLTTVTKASTLATVGMTIATTALNAALTMGVSALITYFISKAGDWIETADELAERVENVTTKYKEQHAELSKLKGDYDTSNEESMISRYRELSKGVNEFGENLALTTDEYEEYQNIVEQITSTNPELIAGYNSQGDAILENAGNVDALAESYRNLIKEQNREILTGKDENDKLKDSFSNAKDILRDFNNDLNKEFDGVTHKGAVGGMNWLEDILGKGALSDKEIEDAVNNLSGMQAMEISRLIEENGIKRDVLGSGDWGYETFQEHVIRAVKENKTEIENTINEVRSNVDSYAESLGAVTGAYFDQAFLGGDETLGIKDYSSKISDRIQGILNQTASELDGISYIDIIGDADTDEAKWEKLTEFYNSTLEAFAKMGDSNAARFEAAFDLRTKFNGGEISYGEYVRGVQEAGLLVDTLGLHDEVEKQIKLSLGLSDTDGDGDGTWSIEQYETMLNRLTSGDYGIQMDDSPARAFLDNLTASEYTVAVGLIMSEEVDLSNFNSESLRNYIEREAKISEALSFNTSIDVDKTALEAFNTALSESASAMGLTSESIGALESKYKKLDGYDSAKLFEATANGVKVNREEVAKLEKQYQDLQKSKTQEHLDTLVDEYNRLTKEIDKNSNAAERAELIAKRNGYLSQIEALAQYQAQLEGVTGAYQRWIDAQNTSEDYEGYEAVAKGWETVKDELSRGFLGNASKEYIDLLSGKDLQGADIDTYAEAWEKLDDKITSTGYSIKDFFTLDDDGNITATGIHRFFESVKKDFDNIYKQNDAGEWIYDFSEDNLKAIQDKWGIGIEAIGLMLEAAVAAGYNVDWGGILDGIDLDTSNFETLLEYAEAAQKAFNDLSEIDDVDFNFKTDNVADATSELEKAQSIYQDLITNDNGKVDISVEGAEQMRVMLSTLLVQKQQLEDSKIAINVDTSGLDESQQDIAKAIEAVKSFREKYKNLEIAVTTGQGIEEAKTALGDALGELQGLGDEGVDIAAKLVLGKDYDGEALKEEINSALPTLAEDANIPVGFKLDETKLGELNSQLKTNFTPDAVNAQINWSNGDTTEVDTYASTEKEANGKVKWSNDDSLVIEFQNTNHSANGTVYWDDNTVNLKTTYTGKGIVYWDTSEANGTDNADGTTSGRAFSRGNWGIKGSGTALGGELGMETLVRDGHFYTIGDNGAEFFKYKQGDIIFNHKQTEELFKNGKVTSGGGRGRMFVNGSAFANGSYPSSGRAFVNASATPAKFAAISKDFIEETAKEAAKEASKEVATVKESDFSGAKSDGNGNGGSGSKSEFEETIDWIETAIDRIERAIDKLDQKANSVYRAWAERNTALADQIGKVGEEIELQQQAYDRYLEEADSIGLSEEYASKVRDGTIDIEKITDEELKKKIDQYTEWYNKAIDCKDAIFELREQESELYAQRFENVQTQYDGILHGYEHTEAMLNEYISQAEERGHIVSKQYYQALIDNEKDNIDELRKEQSDLIAERDNAVASGAIIEGSEAWLEQCAAIDEVTQAIEEGSTALLEYARAMEEIDWEIFDLIQERISGVSEEAEFLIELMSNKKLFDDDGKLTSQGLATMGLHAQNYNSHMYQADTYGEEVANLNAQIEKDPYDQELINRRNELLELQRESILAAEDEKNSIRDMVEEGINLELDALQERIDKYNESIDAAKDLYDYQKNVKEQSEEIASLEKQRAAYLGNDSEEGKAKLQEIEVSLKEAKENLRETEYDKYISDQQALLDTLYNEYELILNQRLDNVDYLLEQVIESINIAASADGIIATALGSEGALAIAIGNNATSIKSTLESESKNVGITLSSAMNSIWSTGEGNAKSVLTMYGEDFRTKSTTIITTLNGIKTGINSMAASLNKEATTKTSANKTSTSAKKDPTKSSATTKTATTNKSSGGDGVPKVGDKVKFVSGQYYYDSQGKKPLGSKNQGKYVYITKVNKENWATHPYHIATDKDGKHPLGWLKLNQLSGYATGKQNFLDDEIAWTQENWENNGREFIIRPSDGAILTPIAKGDSVLTSVASKNIWDMANSPADFIKDNLNLGFANVPSSNVQNSYVQHFENVTFSMPNVHGYDELLKEMQRDPKFEKLILSMSIDRIAGKSSLAKGKCL